ncbi:hypothetical protein TL16_g11656 [Triparma laevis f. inornata]|uniref:RING-type domain-containing protein n=1 Tax=Triparma laevis f. inornata TaxID=1714386 RepID=A0A9W7BP04_9STRA|nr:hypothetical protein TL16_g11656 [Triparma laevis f. inornata]
MGLDLAFCISPESHAGEFTCLICHSLIDLNATSTNPCSHAFCSSCIEPWLKMHQRCPTCNEDLSHNEAVGKLSENEKLAYRVLRRIKVRCPFQDDCDWTGDYGDLQAHMTNDEHFINMFSKSAETGEAQETPQKENPNSTSKPAKQNPKSGNHHGVSVTYKEQGDTRFQANNYVEAQDLYSKALNVFTLQPSLKSTSDGLYTSILANRAAARMMLSDYAGVLKIDNNYVKAAIRKNKALTELGKFEDACSSIRDFATGATSPAIREAVAAEVKRVDGLRTGWTQGQEQFRLKDYGRAKNSFNLLMRGTSAPKVVIAAARSDLGIGLVDSATRLVLQVNRRHATPESLECGGIAMLLSGEFDKAMEYFKEAARMDPELESNKQELRRCRTMRDCIADARRKVFERDFAKAVELYSSVKAAFSDLPRKSPLHATLHVETAGAKLRMKDYAGCLKDCATCLYAKDDCAQGERETARTKISEKRSDEH